MWKVMELFEEWACAKSLGWIGGSCLRLLSRLGRLSESQGSTSLVYRWAPRQIFLEKGFGSWRGLRLRWGHGTSVPGQFKVVKSVFCLSQKKQKYLDQKPCGKMFLRVLYFFFFSSATNNKMSEDFCTRKCVALSILLRVAQSSAAREPSTVRTCHVGKVPGSEAGVGRDRFCPRRPV